jgi:hypothetical protein
MFATNNPSRVNIDEANKHLQMLMERINELEATVKEQTEALIRKDDQTAMQLTEMEREKNSQVGRLQRELRESENTVEQIREMCRDRDITIAKLRQKAAILDDILKYKPMFEKLGFHLIQGERIAVDMAKDSENDYKPMKPPGKGSTRTASSQSHHQDRERAYNGQTVDSGKSSPHHTSTPSHKAPSGSMKQQLATDLLMGTSYGKPSTQDVLYNAFNFDGPSLPQSLQRDPADKELYL